MANEDPTNFPIEWQSEEDKKAKWSRQQIADRYPDPVTPLFADIFFTNLGLAVKKMGEELDILKKGFEPRYVIFNGYVYANLDPRNMSKAKLVRLIFQLYTKADQVERNFANQMEVPHLQRISKLQQFDLNKASMLELDTHLKELESCFGAWMVNQSITLFFTEVGIKIFEILTKLLFGRVVPNLQFKLTSGFENESIKMNREVARIASLIQTNEDKKLFEEYSGKELLEKVNSASSLKGFQKEFQSFLDEQGIRTTHWDFVYPTWKEAPEIPLDFIKSFVAGSANIEDKLKEQEASREDAIKLIESKFTKQFWKKPFKKFYFKWVDLAQRYTILKERRQINMYKIWYLVRVTLHEIGIRLKNASMLKENDEIFFLRRTEIYEIVLAITKNEITENWKADYQKLVNERRKAWNKQFELEPPVVIQWKRGTKITRLGKAKTLTGTTASTGLVTAKANVILNPQDFGHFQKGQILVTKYTNPSWTPLFVLASGVVTEAGGMLSHAAIVAREYGIPAIVGVPNATKLIQNHETITLNGNDGTISKNNN